jgi:hypothetical protein
MARLRGTRLLVVALVVLVLGSVPASAQQDERIKPLLDKAQAFFDQAKNAFVRIEQQVTVNGQRQQDDIQEVWIRDMDHFRMEKADGTILTLTPDDVKLIHGPSKVVLHIPKETLEKLGDQREEALARIGIGLPSRLMRGLKEHPDAMAITGEEVIDDEPCWVLSATPEGLKAAAKFLNVELQPGQQLVSFQVALGKENGTFRGIYMDIDAQVRIAVQQKVTAIQADTEVKDEQLTFETPRDATVIEWTPDVSAATVRERFQQAVAAAMAQPKPQP